MEMNNNQNLYLLNAQQQYYNPYSFETQGEQTQELNFFNYQGQFQSSNIRSEFIQNMYTFLAIEFLFNLGMMALGFYTGMGSWLVRLNCLQDFEEGFEFYSCLTPSWLFYVSLFVSIILQMMLYFGGNFARKDPLNYVVLLLQLIFFGFTFATICIFMVLSLQELVVWITWGLIFIIILIFKILGVLNKKEISLLQGAIIIVGASIPLILILIFLRYRLIWEKCLSGFIIVIYGIYLMFETRFIMSNKRLNLQLDQYLFGSLLLNGLMFQPLVRIFEMIFFAFGRNN
ncbi:unnamed protein product [Paramecium sonneborni]|uniref:Transmembrane protein n=1 Tax=Paramecium sonneborni TaxID=65129 RepID=A0A8S1KLX0_9CILI|nr:unnamed protein product [Paramecium sonneborni]